MHKYLFIFLSLFIISCKKSGNQPEEKNEVDVYVAGYKQIDNRNYATYWKNGVEKSLSNTDSRASSIAVKGNDVYIGGAVDRPNYNKGVYWKNDQLMEIPLPDSPNPFVPGVISIVFDDNDFYIFSEYNRYTKNNVTIDYSNSSATNAISVKGGKVARITNDAAGFYYREGTMPGGSLLPGAYTIGAVLLDGTDYYAAGVRVTTINNKNYYTAGYWKNGTFEQAEPLNTPQSIIIRGMAINQNGVYIAGMITDEVTGQMPVYWHKGKINYLPVPEGTHIGAARCIILNGNDIYISGEVSNRPCYWKNGTLMLLGSEGTRGQARGIALMQR